MYCPSCETVIINNLESPAVKETSLTLKQNKTKQPAILGLWHPVSAEYLLKKNHFEKTSLRTVAHSYCIFYRMVGNLFFLMFRRLCGGRLVMAYFQNSRFLFGEELYT